MTENVVHLPRSIRHDTPVADVFQGAMERGLKGVVILGWTEDGEEFFASSYADAAEAGWLMQRGIYKLCQIIDRIESGEVDV